jgi:hypothetical protein
MTDNSYIRITDGATMIETAPHQFVNIEAARKLGIVGHSRPASKEVPEKRSDAVTAEFTRSG